MATSSSTTDVLDTSQAGGRVIRGGGLRIAAQIGGLLVGTVSTPIVVRHLGPSGYGNFQTVASLIFIVSGITEGGLGNLGIREFSTLMGGERVAFMRDLLGLRISMTTIAAAAAILFAVSAGYKPVLVEGTAISAAGMLVLIVQHTLSLPLTAQLRLGVLALLDFVRQLATAMIMVALALAGASLLPFYIVAPVTALLVLVPTTALVRHDTALVPRVNPRAWLGLLKQTLVYAAASALGVAYFQIAMLAMSLLSSAHERGIYAVPFRIVDLGNMIPWLLVGSAFPVLARAARDDADRLRYALQRMFEVGLMLGCLIAVLAVVGAPFGIHLVGGAKFDRSVAVLRILGVGIPATYLVATWSFALLSLHRHAALMICNAVALVTAFALSGILIPAYGARGAGIVTGVLELVLSSAYCVALWRARRELRPDMRLVPRIALAVGAALAAGLLLPVPSLPGAVIAGAVYLAVLLALRAFPAELWLAIRGKV
jgi:O-antigen/teichoic acid export membrane protein